MRGLVNAVFVSESDANKKLASLRAINSIFLREGQSGVCLRKNAGKPF